MKKILGICAVASFVLSGDSFGWTTQAKEGLRKVNARFDELKENLSDVKAEKDKLTKENKELEEANKDSEAIIDFFSKKDGKFEALKTLEQKKAAAEAGIKKWVADANSRQASMFNTMLNEDPTQLQCGTYDPAQNPNGYNVDDALGNFIAGGTDANLVQLFAQLVALGNRAEVADGANGKKGCVAGNNLPGYRRLMAESYVREKIASVIEKSGIEQGGAAFYKYNNSYPLAFLDEDHKTFDAAYDLDNNSINVSDIDFSTYEFVGANGKGLSWVNYLSSKQCETQQDTIDALIEYLSAVCGNSEGLQYIDKDGNVVSASFMVKNMLLGQVLGLFNKDGIIEGDYKCARPFLANKDDNGTVDLVAYEKELSDEQMGGLFGIVYYLTKDINNSFK